MVKQGIVPDELTKPFFDAANDERLVIQNCTACDRLQHPPAPACSQCGSGDGLEWKEMSGRGKIYNYGVVYDTPVRLLQRSEEHTSELQSRTNLVCRLLLEKKKTHTHKSITKVTC